MSNLTFEEFDKVNEAATKAALEAGNLLIDLCADSIKEIGNEHDISRGSYVGMLMLALVKMSGTIVETACYNGGLKNKREKEFLRRKFLDMVRDNFDNLDKMNEEQTFSFGLN